MCILLNKCWLHLWVQPTLIQQHPHVLYDCYVPVTKQTSFIYHLLEKCTKIKFSNTSVLDTFMRKHRSDDCLISVCPPDSSFNFMERMLMHMMWVSWTLLVSDLRADRTPKCGQALSFRHNTPILKNVTTHVSWQKIAETKPEATIIFLFIFASWFEVYGILLRLSQSSINFAVLFLVL